MNLVVIGVNHKTAPVALRERLAFVGGDIQVAQAELQKIEAKLKADPQNADLKAAAETLRAEVGALQGQLQDCLCCYSD